MKVHCIKFDIYSSPNSDFRCYTNAGRMIFQASSPSEGPRREGQMEMIKVVLLVLCPAPRLHPTVDHLLSQVCLEAHQNLPLFSLGNLEIGP